MPIHSRIGGGLAVLLCMAALLMNAVSLFPRQLGIDFYQFWGVPVARQVSATPLSPYVDAPGYARTLNRLADDSSSGKLRAANHLRRRLEPMGTPFLYASFSFFPTDYATAQALFAIIQHLATGLAVVLLARLRGIAILPAICIAALVELAFNPFIQEVKVGNVNSLQLLYMVLLLDIAARGHPAKNAFVDALFVGSLALFFIFKPNTLWIAAALALHYWAAAGHRRFFRGVAMAAVLSALAFVVGAWYFEHAGVWWEWLQFARALDGSGLPLTLQDGNVALAMLLAQGSSAYGSVAFGALISASLLLAVFMALSATGRRPDIVAKAAVAAFSDPWFALSIGVIFTFATYPLVWPHYHLFALIPIFWLFRREGRWDAATWGAALCFVAFSRPVLELLNLLEFTQATLVLVVFAWMPVIPGTFAFLIATRRRLESPIGATG